jgi:kynureninase
MLTDESYALSLDAADPLGWLREQFFLPHRLDGSPAVYFCGHSLGLQPKRTKELLDRELEDWATMGVAGHFKESTPWYSYADLVTDSLARLVGAQPAEVIAMNSLTVNLHLLLATSYRPTDQRYKILIDAPTFPSDLYAVQSQIRHHGRDPAEALILVGPRGGERTVRFEDIEATLQRHGREIAVVVWNAVNFQTGQLFDLARLTAAAHRQGCLVGFDLAHAIGNVPLDLHANGADFAVWCHYKYVNAGPGAVAGAFVHERHANNLDLPRMAGWWGNEPATRFRMHRESHFVPRPGAAGWQVSNPPIFSLVPLRASLELFDRAGMTALRAKSLQLTSYLEYLLDHFLAGRLELLTPRDPTQRGCQLSIRIGNQAGELVHSLEADGIVCDFREPDVIRVAPAPMYNTFREVWRFAKSLAAAIS